MDRKTRPIAYSDLYFLKRFLLPSNAFAKKKKFLAFLENRGICTSSKRKPNMCVFLVLFVSFGVLFMGIGLFLFGGHTWLWSEYTPGVALRDHFSWASGIIWSAGNQTWIICLQGKCQYYHCDPVNVSLLH